MKIEPPKPPPMRVGNGTPTASSAGFYICTMLVCLAVGVLCGLKMAGA